MKLSFKNFFLFLFLYVIIILVSNFTIGFIYGEIGWRFNPPIPGGSYSYLKLPFPTVGHYAAALPPEMIEKFDLKINYSGIFFNILLLIGSFYLVFIKKIKFHTWAILFTIFSFLTIVFFFISEIPR